MREAAFAGKMSGPLMPETEPPPPAPARLDACVLGAGPFGTALAICLAGNCREVRLWGRDAGLMQLVNERHENPRHLPGIALPANVRASLAMPEALDGASLVVLAVPSHVLRGVAAAARPHLRDHAPIVSTSKSIERGTLFTMTELLQDCLPEALHPYLAVFSGPSFAKELAMRRPTVVTISARSSEVTARCRQLLQTDWLRLHADPDVIGVQLGAALKNVIAIAVGISEGLGLGANMKAALVTLGLEEIGRLLAGTGSDPHTLCGLSGLGDLVLTSSGPMSRSWQVGAELAKGRAFPQILQAMGKEMIEGATTAASVEALAKRAGVELPICTQVSRVLEGRSAADAMAELQRELFRR